MVAWRECSVLLREENDANNFSSVLATWCADGCCLLPLGIYGFFWVLQFL